MSHMYSLRPHAKGRRGHQTADEPEGQVKGTAPIQDSEEDWRRTTRYRVQGPAETSEEIQEARKRVEARRVAEASRIRREQIVRGYEEDLRALRARVEALRRECEVQVEKLQRKWVRDWGIERGEVVVVVEEEEETGEEEDIGSSSSRLHPSQPQPLQRQPAQLILVPTTSLHGL